LFDSFKTKMLWKNPSYWKLLNKQLSGLRGALRTHSGANWMRFTRTVLVCLMALMGA
jgi:hypothetical protein